VPPIATLLVAISAGDGPAATFGRVQVHGGIEAAVHIHRVRAAGTEGSEAFDTMLRNRDVNRLFNGGALHFELPGATPHE
jgi:hypothetical protein